jgi:hypothetical protein
MAESERFSIFSKASNFRGFVDIRVDRPGVLLAAFPFWS